MEIQLKEKQLQILAKIQADKQILQAEYAKVVQKETDVLTLIIEGAGLDSASLVGSSVEIKEGGILYIPEPEKEK